MCAEELPALTICLEAGAARLLKIEERLHEGKDGTAEEIAKRRRGRCGQHGEDGVPDAHRPAALNEHRHSAEDGDDRPHGDGRA